MHPHVEVLASQARLHRRLFENCLDGVDDAIAVARPNDVTNHLAFLACHLTEAREYLIEILGGDKHEHFPEIPEITRVDDYDDWPPVERIRAAWQTASKRLETTLEAATGETLETSIEMPFLDDPTVDGFATFLLHHEAYHIGQMALLRKYFGLPAMEYGG